MRTREPFPSRACSVEIRYESAKAPVPCCLHYRCGGTQDNRTLLQPSRRLLIHGLLSCLHLTAAATGMVGVCAVIVVPIKSKPNPLHRVLLAVTTILVYFLSIAFQSPQPPPPVSTHARIDLCNRESSVTVAECPLTVPLFRPAPQNLHVQSRNRRRTTPTTSPRASRRLPPLSVFRRCGLRVRMAEPYRRKDRTGMLCSNSDSLVSASFPQRRQDPAPRLLHLLGRHRSRALG